MSRSVRFARFGGPEVLTLVEGPDPIAGPGQIRVRVRTVGLNPVDHKILHGGPVAEAFGVVPPAGIGSDFAGTVDQVGDGVEHLSVGDEVLGNAGGTLADHVVLPAGVAVPKPAALSWELAGALPVVGRAAWASVASLGLTAEDTVLISAAAGGVGVLACQLARATGATVVGTAGPGNAEFLTSLGVIPVAHGPGLVERLREAAPQGYTAALDNHGPASIEAALEVGVPATRINTIAAFGGPEGITYVGAMAATNDDLASVAAMLADGTLTLPIEATYPLEAVAEAYRRLEEGHVRGKLVVTLV